MIDFKDVLQEVKASKAYSGLCKNYPEFYLAHGFMQLDANYAMTKRWQVGYYSIKEDKLAVFSTDPVTLQPFEEAFKDGGIIKELTEVDSLKTTEEILSIVREELKGEQLEIRKSHQKSYQHQIDSVQH